MSVNRSTKTWLDLLFASQFQTIETISDRWQLEHFTSRLDRLQETLVRNFQGYKPKIKSSHLKTQDGNSRAVNVTCTRLFAPEISPSGFMQLPSLRDMRTLLGRQRAGCVVWQGTCRSVGVHSSDQMAEWEIIIKWTLSPKQVVVRFSRRKWFITYLILE